MRISCSPCQRRAIGRAAGALVVAGWYAATVPLAARAQPPPDVAKPPASPERAAAGVDDLARAKELFHKGVRLLEAGQLEQALEAFLKSRDVYPSGKNTANAAVCLEQLGRYDEALEMYEELLAKHLEELDADDRASLGPTIDRLGKKVGSIAVTSNVVGGIMLVDGRPRGRLPLSIPPRVVAGRHIVRVFRDGYATFERSVDVRAGAVIQLDARLEPLVGAGQLRVEDPSNAGADVFVDGVLVGAAPWEGTLGAGRHAVWTRNRDRGSAPASVVLLEGQTTLLRARSASLGPPLSIRVEPSTAELHVDGIAVGAGGWEGRLPMGEHVVVVTEAGYIAQTVRLPASPDSAPMRRVSVELVVDPSHPRWPKPGHFWVQALGGYAGARTLAATAEGDCPASCSSSPIVNGFRVGARGGYRFPLGLSVTFGGGYMAFGASFDRTKRDSFGKDGAFHVTYRLHDDLRVAGPFVAVGASHRLGLGSRFGAIFGLEVGALFAAARDPITGTASTDGEAVPILLSDRYATLWSVAGFVNPRAGIEARWGPIDVGVSLGLAFFVGQGPTFPHASFGATPSQDPAHPGAVGNSPLSGVIAGERAYGAFLLWVPEISLGHTF
jgi:hypothetical protein